MSSIQVLNNQDLHRFKKNNNVQKSEQILSKKLELSQREHIRIIITQVKT